MRRFYLSILLSISAIAVNAQTAANYVFSQVSGTYNSIAGTGTLIWGDNTTFTTTWDDGNSPLLNLGFNFWYCGTNYTTAGQNCNGWIRMGTTTASTYTPLSTYASCIAALGEDNWWNGPATPRNINYITTGTAPTRKFTVQWNNGCHYNTIATGPYNYQINLYESSNVVEIAYGNFSGITSTTGYNAHVGINGPTTASFNNRTSTTSWTATTAGTANSSTVSHNNTNVPPSGLTFRWTPPPTVSVNPTTVPGFTANTSTTSTAQTFTLTAWGLTSGSVTVTAPANFQIFNGSAWVTSMNVNTVAAGVGTYVNQVIQVRFVAPGAPGTYTGNITCASTGATTQNVAVSGLAILVCSGTPAPGTVTASATTGSCTPYVTNLSVPATTGIGSLQFQWQSSPDNIVAYGPIAGATNATYSPTISANIYYRCNVTCGVSGISTPTPGLQFLYNAPPTAITGGSSIVCQGLTTTFASTPTTGATWSSSNGTIASVNSAGVVTGLAPGTANIIYTITSSGCNVSRTISVNGAPGVSVSPVLTTVCGSGTSTITATVNSAGSPTATSGALSGYNIDNLLAPAIHSVSLGGIPSGATITGMTVTVNATHTYVGDCNINLRSPSGSILNLFNQHGGGGDNWSNTIVSMNGATTFASSAAPYSGTYAATGASGVGIAPNLSDVTNFSSLIGTTPNGSWTLIVSDHAGGDVGTLNNWGVTITYTMAVTNSFAPTTGLFTNPGLTTPYTGANILTVYANPASTTVYSATATAGGCSSIATSTFSINPVPAAIGGPTQVCEGRTITMTNAASGTWVSGTPSVATVTGSGATATVTGGVAGTAIITFTLPSGCKTTQVVTVLATPAPIVTATSFNVCEEGTLNLTHPDGTGSWTSADPMNATIGFTSGVVTGIASGIATISYTGLNTCVRTRDITVNPLPSVNVTPAATATICIGNTATFTANSPSPQMNLLSQDFEGTLGSWNVSNVGTPASHEPWQLTTPPGLAGVSGDGSQYLQAYSQAAALPVQTTLTSPSFSTTGGFGSVTLTFNQTLLSFAPPDVEASVEYSVSGGPWTLLTNQANSVLNAGGTWVAANPEVTIPLPGAAIGSSDVRLRWVYNAQSLYWTIDNISVKGTMPPSDFMWSGPGSLSCTNCASATLTPVVAGANLYNVATTTSAGCVVNTPVTVNVNALPDAITGGLTVCEGITNMLVSGPGSGTWQESSGGAIATIVSGTGALTGVATGNTTVTFTETTTGCQRSAMANVLAAPAPVVPASAAICINNTLSLSNATGSGVWSSADGGIATVSSTGLVTGVSNGVVNITYTISSGCVSISTITVNALPAAISGASAVCVDATTLLTNTDPFGTWSGGGSFASVNSSTGDVLGVAAGNTIITYTLPSGCFAVKAMLVNTIPNASGPSAVCQGQTAIFSGGSTGATWSSSSPAIATINSSGVVTTNSTFSGSLNILYTFTAGGCARVMPFTVNTKAPITGPTSVCEAATAALANIIPGGTWASANDLIATVDPMTGVVTGENALNTTISYTTPAGCTSTRSIVVNALPSIINGSNTVCENGTTTLNNSTPMGIWTSSVPSVATINSFGEVTAMTNSGTTIISYTLITTGCRRTHNLAVTPLPDMIGGTAAACASGGTTLLTSAPTGGAWSSSNSLVAAAGSTTGIITGNVAGSTMITYLLPTGCFRTQSVVVNPLPNSITGTPTVCEGLTTDLNNSTMGGTWTSLDAGIATVDQVTGLVHGEDDGVVGIAYTLATGCARTRMVTVNVVPDAFAGTLSACPGQTSALSTSPAGGTWSSGTSSIAGVNASGVVSAHAAGNANISYTMPTGCRTVSQFTVNPLPTTIIGVRAVCIGNYTTLTNGITGGTWAMANTVIGSVDANTGVVNGLSQGVTVVTYELPTGCIRTANVTVNALPNAIAGATSVCQMGTTPLTSGPAGGTWTSANATIASIGATTGIVTGASEGVVNISYTLPTGCRATTAIEVMPLPADITGASAVCESQVIPLNNTTPNGTWSVDNSMIAMVDANGNVTGMGAGNAVVKYQLPTGCYKTKTVVVNPLPAPIAGNTTICQGANTVLTNATTLGTWSSSNPVVAPVTPAGNVYGSNTGFAIIHYTLPTGCATNATVVVNALPEPITGAAAVCSGSQATVESATTGGVWTSSSAVATITQTGVVTGVAAGTSNISYTNSNGCRRTRVMTVHALPGLITGGTAICPGLNSTLGNTATGGTWSSDNVAMVAVHPTAGIAMATGADGMANVTYVLPTGCSRTTQVTVHPSVDAITGANTICNGNSTTFANTTNGGMWASSNTDIASVDAMGVVTGEGAGTTSIAYVMPTGCKSIRTVIVNPLPGNITGAAAVCKNSTIALGNSLAGGTWSSSADSVATVNAAGMVTGVEMGSVTMRYELPTGCFMTRALVVNALPDVKNVTGGGSYCAGGTGVAIGVDGSQAGTLYKLMLGTSPVITTVGTGGLVDYGNQLTDGVYIVTAVSPTGCMQDMNGDATVVITPLTTPSVTMTSDMGETVCAGAAVTYTATGVNGGTTPSYVWSVNGVAVASTSAYTFVPADGDNVTIKFVSSAACPAPASVTSGMSMTVLPNLTPSVSIAVGPNDSVCEGSAAIFAAAAVNAGSAPLYTWLVNGSIVAGVTGSVYNYQPANNDVVLCRLNSSYACATTNDVSSNSVKMHVDRIFTPIVDMTANPGVKVQQGTEVTFTATPQDAGDTPVFQWLINNNAIEGATQPVFKTSDLENGDSVTCIVVSNGKCANVSINSIVMEITPNTTGMTTKVIGNSEVRLVPNPNTGSFTVSGTLASKADENLTFEVTDMLGQVVYRNTSVARNGVISERIELGKTLANGMYMLNIGVGTERKAFHFVVKQ